MKRKPRISFRRSPNCGKQPRTELSRLMVKRKLTTAEVARVIGVGPTTVNAWRAGRSAPEQHNWRKLAEILRLPMNSLSRMQART